MATPLPRDVFVGEYFFLTMLEKLLEWWKEVNLRTVEAIVAVKLWKVRLLRYKNDLNGPLGG